MRSVFLALFALVIGTAVWAQSDYRVRPGDLLSVEVLQDSSLNRDVLVLPDGQINFPYAGTLKAGGLTVGDIQKEIASGIAPNFSVAPTVFVSVRQIPVKSATAGSGGSSGSITVYFLGEFASPGMKTLKRGTTFLQALAEGGAFTNFAALKRLQLRRTDASGRQSVTTINYRAISNGRGSGQAITLRSGDIILAPSRRLFE